MDLKEIQELMVAMEKMAIKRLRFKQENVEIELEREDAFGDNPLQDLSSKTIHTEPKHSNIRVTDIPAALHAPLDTEKSHPQPPGTYIKSPMVGTFYLSSGPDEPPFIKVGDSVNKDTVACIVEAMKVMNEIKAGISGTIAEVLVENGHPVEFGTRLFRVVS